MGDLLWRGGGNARIIEEEKTTLENNTALKTTTAVFCSFVLTYKQQTAFMDTLLFVTLNICCEMDWSVGCPVFCWHWNKQFKTLPVIKKLLRGSAIHYF